MGVRHVSMIKFHQCIRKTNVKKSIKLANKIIYLQVLHHSRVRILQVNNSNALWKFAYQEKQLFFVPEGMFRLQTKSNAKYHEPKQQYKKRRGCYCQSKQNRTHEDLHICENKSYLVRESFSIISYFWIFPHIVKNIFVSFHVDMACFIYLLQS